MDFTPSAFCLCRLLLPFAFCLLPSPQYSPRGPIAQRLERPAHNRLVPGSNPGGPTQKFPVQSAKFKALGKRPGAHRQPGAAAARVAVLNLALGTVTCSCPAMLPALELLIRLQNVETRAAERAEADRRRAGRNRRARREADRIARRGRHRQAGGRRHTGRPTHPRQGSDRRPAAAQQVQRAADGGEDQRRISRDAASDRSRHRGGRARSRS